MPNNTAVREHLMTYLRELQVKATGGEQYEAVLEALSGLVQKTDRLYRRDDQGQHIPMTPEDRPLRRPVPRPPSPAPQAIKKAPESP